ncbi:permease-like cell division protein FtsX [Caldibacillus lycopersici]|uniref:Cell division protein FtsX n=1 Tax=Perspicuibacillus lycopersici TaxID=1325689 RepID=A0AAE3IT41_9BACI|nr:permease-like cell division protein FtsX [Perspicuibacillus lycopersici]MCU9612964.1 permease-like cell division protein FtsX [Perspicuibacillus lycopersici]
MKFRTIGRHLKESLKNIVRNGWMTFASVSAVTVTLVLVGVFFIILMNLNQVATSIEEDVEIKVLIDTTATDADQEKLTQQIKDISEVGSVTFSSKEKELDALIDSFGEDADLFKQLYEERNPLNAAFIVKTKDPLDTMKAAEKIEKLDFVYKVRYGQNDVEKLFDIIKVSRNVGIVLIIGLLFTAIFLISNTIKITIVARRKEIEIMRLVGATNSFIRWPFFLEGLWLGILGSIIPITAIIVLYKEISTFLEPKLVGNFIQILDFNPFAYQVSGILLLIGCVIGVWGSLMSVHKFLKI